MFNFLCGNKNMTQQRKAQFAIFDRELGARIRYFRKLRKLTQSELATCIGISYQQIQKYEKGHSSLSAARLASISHVLNITPDEMMGFEAYVAPKLLSPNTMMGQDGFRLVA
jgi:transcriptional regulator with XRE-family HTH domain